MRYGVPMVALSVSRTLQVPIEHAWSELSVIARHVEWMNDATEIRFRTTTEQGVGTTFECDTNVGPITLTDVMEITLWDPPERMGVHHVGVVTGSGVISFTALSPTTTEMHWNEHLNFPPWLLSAFGARCARPIMSAIWKRSLENFATRVEKTSAPSS